MSTAAEIFDNVMKAMQPAEEIGGPDGQEYMKLMADIAMMATARLRNYAASIWERIEGD